MIKIGVAVRLSALCYDVGWLLAASAVDAAAGHVGKMIVQRRIYELFLFGADAEQREHSSDETKAEMKAAAAM